ncbi:MAG: hypothetical protein KJO38_08730, partial [Gammaproteobacteria bacterium]|nr:hypothetical protein [Gammaproteobacteria bacterium]
MLLILSACGGGGGGGGGTGGGFLPTDPNAGLTNYNLNLSLTDSAGNPVTAITPNRPAILRATVTEANGVAAAVEGVVVTAVVQDASISPENGSAITNSQGVATFEILGDQILGADQAVVTVESPAGTVEATIAFQIFDISLNFDVTLLDAAGFETTFIAPDQPGEVRVRVTQVNPDGSETVPDEPLVINAQTGFAVVSPANVAALTNADGVATFGLSPGTISGADTLNLTATIASGDEFTSAFPFQILTNQDEFSISLAMIDGSGAITNQIDAASPATLRALLTRSNPITGVVGEPVEGQILFATSSDGIITPENGSALTDGSGSAEFGVATGNSLGAQTITVSVNGPGGTTAAELPYTSVADVEGSGYVALFLELQLRNAAGQTISSFDRGESGFLRVRVLGRREGSQIRELVPGIPVSITAANGLIDPASGNLLTNGSGEANFVIQAGAVSGTDVITASVLGPVGPVAESLSYDVTGVSLVFNTRLVDESGLQTSFIAPGQPGQLRVTVRELNANGSQSIPDSPVVVSATGGIADVIPDNGSVVTDASGVAVFTLQAGTVSGAEIITLTAESDSGETTTSEFPLQVFTGSDEFTISVALLDADGAVTTQITPGSPGELVAILRRSNPLAGVVNAPVAGQILEVSLTDGTVTPPNGARLTNAQG